MNKEFRISTGEDLIQFFETEKLTSNEISQILEKGLMLFADESKPPEVLIQEFKEYWERWKHTRERPLFLGLNLDVK
ncbi:hypothetical protein [Zunongwangia profunda]|uniref:hypothetical protein n=1 Tax=Zunongwangia profunda TaxID=398743 RepID=UPI001D18D144|nr:hypothetical protein [Zunongwangia profunda]MCC4230032.1 hypothetical protein [Zunongwangia profunda]